MRTFGLIGHPLTHSFSQKFFSQKFLVEAIHAQYLNFDIESIQFLPELIKNHLDLEGFNVTIPYKEQVIPFLDFCDPEAESIGAVNTVKIYRKGDKVVLKGYNTDLYGFRESIRPLLKREHQKALVLGSGGASKAVVKALSQLSVHSLLVSRKDEEGVSIAYDALTKTVMENYSIVVNTTPLGTFPNTETLPDLPYELLSGEHLLYDLVYNPPVSAFLKKGLEAGCMLKNGAEMLELQALAAWDVWND
jgi:shikimate dehydrogenase